jgi:hypothetical protein
MKGKEGSSKSPLRALVLALMVSAALAAATTGSASAATQSWRACELGTTLGETTYQDSNCTIVRKTGEYSWHYLTEPTRFTMVNSGNITLNLPLFGVTANVTCSSLSLEGTIENHALGSGTFAQSGADKNFTLSGCTVNKPAGCGISNPVTFVDLNGEATEFEGKPAVKFSAASGTALTSYDLTNCGIFNGGHTVTGYFTGIAQPSTSALEFTAASTNLETGGFHGGLEGTAAIHATVGEATYPLTVNH